MSMRSSLVSDCNSLIKKASTRKGEAFCVKRNGGVLSREAMNGHHFMVMIQAVPS